MAKLVTSLTEREFSIKPVIAKQGKPTVYLATFSNYYLLAMTMLRMQEYYESNNPNIQGKVFTLEDLIDANVDEQGIFSYANDWYGFNLPCDVVRNFYTLFISSLTKKEELFQEVLLRTVTPTEQYYLIGAKDKDYSTIKHELAHGIYAIDTTYRETMNDLIKKWKKDKPSHYKQLSSILFKYGYSKTVVTDEIHAYASTETKQTMSRLGFNFGFPPEFKKVLNAALDVYLKDSDLYSKLNHGKSRKQRVND